MKKFLLSLATVLCAGAFASADEVTFDFSTNQYGMPADNATYVTLPHICNEGAISLELNATTKNNAVRVWNSAVRFYKNKGAYFTLSTSNGTITKVELTVSGATFAVDGTTTNVTSWEGSATSIKFNYTNNSGNKDLKKIVVTYTPDGGVVVPTPTFSIASGTFSEAQTVELSAEDGCTIYYTLNGQDPTDDVDDGSTIKYTAPISITETTTIKAVAVDADDNFSSIVSATYKIVELLEGATGAGTEADPYNPIAAYNEGLKGSTAKIYVKGIVSEVASFNSSYNSLSYYISEDGTETNQFYIYSGLGLDGAAFTSTDDLKVGDEVVVYGQLTTYNDAPQLNYNSIIIELNGNGAVDEPVVLEGEGSDSNPFTVADVIAINPTESSANEDYPDKYWVKGYIVGYSSSSSSAFTPIFNADAADSKTNLILGPTADCTDKSLCVPVQLPSGNVRNALNLVDNASNLGKEVYVYGNIYKYFLLPGVKNVTDYKLDPSGIADVELDNNAPVEYFNLQGVRVANPENGLFIMRQGDKVVKVIK